MGIFVNTTKEAEVEVKSCGKINFKELKTDKEQIINLFILDRSGSMNSLRKAAIDGFNETINGIRVAQEKYSNSQDHYVTLLTFCGCSKIFVYENTPIAEVKDLTLEDYVPCCNTPLYDAMGLGINRLRGNIEGVKNCTVIATIITDGYENSSDEFTAGHIKEIVNNLTEKGWIFNYMGTNQDVTAISQELEIRNHYEFENSVNGLKDCLLAEISASEKVYDAINNYQADWSTKKSHFANNFFEKDK